MQNAKLDEAPAEIKIAGRNINKFRYADDTTLMAEAKRKVEKAGLKLNIQKTKIVASGSITSWKIDGGPRDQTCISCVSCIGSWVLYH